MDLVPNEWTQQAGDGILNGHIPSIRIPPSPVQKPPPMEKSPLRCPRCNSSNTKFCYYNNYSLSQPRHFCKSCKRYWTRGGTLRNVPVGGGCRKNKRVRKASPLTSFPPLNDISQPVSFFSGSPSVGAPSTDLGFLFSNFHNFDMGLTGFPSANDLSLGDGCIQGLGQISQGPAFLGFGLHQVSSSEEVVENKGFLGFTGIQQLDGGAQIFKDVRPTVGSSHGQSEWEITSCENAVDFPLFWNNGLLTDSSNCGFPITPLL